MTNLGGHDIETVIDCLRTAEAEGDQPTCFIAYTIKGMGLPFAGHKDNHSGLMSKEQMEQFRREMGIRPGHEWDLFEGLDVPEEELRSFLHECPFGEPLTPQGRLLSAPSVLVPPVLPMPKLGGRKMSTQGGFGEILAEIGRGQGELKDLAAHARFWPRSGGVKAS
jgi:pyruvate dehydrogenase E1 component